MGSLDNQPAGPTKRIGVVCVCPSSAERPGAWTYRLSTEFVVQPDTNVETCALAAGTPSTERSETERPSPLLVARTRDVETSFFECSLQVGERPGLLATVWANIWLFSKLLTPALHLVAGRYGPKRTHFNRLLWVRSACVDAPLRMAALPLNVAARVLGFHSWDLRSFYGMAWDIKRIVAPGAVAGPLTPRSLLALRLKKLIDNIADTHDEVYVLAHGVGALIAEDLLPHVRLFHTKVRVVLLAGSPADLCRLYFPGPLEITGPPTTNEHAGLVTVHRFDRWDNPLGVLTDPLGPLDGLTDPLAGTSNTPPYRQFMMDLAVEPVLVEQDSARDSLTFVRVPLGVALGILTTWALAWAGLALSRFSATVMHQAIDTTTIRALWQMRWLDDLAYTMSLWLSPEGAERWWVLAVLGRLMLVVIAFGFVSALRWRGPR